MPVLFIGHGSPMNANEDNGFSRAWIEMGKSLPRPKAVLCVSAHWETNRTQLTRLFPKADVPVVQSSLDRVKNAQAYYDLGRQLKELREQGVLILGSGNIVHNLGMMLWEDTAFDWAVEFDAKVRQWILEDDHESIIQYHKQGRVAALAINSAEHYKPLLYALGSKDKDEPFSFFTEKIWGGSLSMRSMRIG